MSKKKPGRVSQRAATLQERKDAEVTRLSVHMNTEEVHEIECSVCHDEYRADSIDSSEFLEDLYDMGWRTKDDSQRVVCPQCGRNKRL